jgi:hypothetical protein
MFFVVIPAQAGIQKMEKSNFLRDHHSMACIIAVNIFDSIELPEELKQ